MTSTRTIISRPASLLLSSLLTLAFAAPALADTTCGDTTCPTGFECVAYESDCAAPAIDDGSAPAEDVAMPECVATTVYSCEPGPCASDADCATGMVCFTDTVSECSGGAAVACDPEGTDCVDMVEAPECVEKELSQCIPQYLLPCEAAADCGVGFTCEEQESCGCSGSAGSAGGATGSGVDGVSEPSSSEEAADLVAPEEPTCVCEGTGTFACVPQLQACSTDADCPESWTCGENPDSVCSISSDGVTDCPEPEPAKLCLPPYYDVIGAVTGGSAESGDGLLTGNSEDDSGTVSGEDTRADGAEPSGGDAGGGGCSVAGTPRAPGSLLFSLLGLAFGASFLRRRS